MERSALTWCKPRTTLNRFILLILMVLVFGIAVHQKLEYFRFKYTTSLSNPTFVHSSNTASGKPLQLDLNDSEKMTEYRLAKRTGDKMKEIHSGNPTFVHSSNTASGKPRQLDLNDSEKMTKSRSAKRTGDKMKEIHSGNSLKTVPQKQQVREESVRPPVKEEIDTIFEERALKHSARLQQFRENCRRLKCEGDTSRVKYDLFYSRDYNLAWKLVPKIGSTFLIQVFGILNEEVNRKVFDEARSSIHTDDFSYRKKFSLKKLNNYTVLITTRNPFSRLFSAYIDKVYLPNKKELPEKLYLRKVSKFDPRDCPFKNTFNDFLDYALKENTNRIGIGHYGPVLSETKCMKFCDIQNVLIVKQESFSDDIDYALNIAGIKGNKYQNIYNAMHGKNAQSAIVSIAKTIYMKMARDFKKIRSYTVSKDCLSWSDVAQRLWKAFQIQGYIHDTTAFPHDRFHSNAQYEDVDYLVKIMLEEIEKRPLTHEEKKNQRTKALLDAYSEVSEENISKIIKQYYYDFSLYDYSTDVKHALEINT